MSRKPNIDSWVMVVLAVVMILLAIATDGITQSSNINRTPKATNNNIQAGEPCATSKLPEVLINRKAIRDMRVGEKRLVVRTVMTVDEDGKCYLYSFLNTDETKEAELGEYWIGVERRLEGFYVTVRQVKGKPTWNPENIAWKRQYLKDGDLVPVCKVTVVK